MWSLTEGQYRRVALGFKSTNCDLMSVITMLHFPCFHRSDDIFEDHILGAVVNTRPSDDQKVPVKSCRQAIHSISSITPYTTWPLGSGHPVWNAMYMRFFLSPHTCFVQCPSFDWRRKNVQSNLRSKAGAPSSIIRNIQWILSITFCSLTRTEGEENWWRKGRLMC